MALLAQNNKPVNNQVKKLKAMAEIRRLVAKGYNTSEILNQVPNLSRRSFYRYLAQVFEHDRKVLQDQNSTEEIMKQFMIMIDRYNTIYRHLEDIATDSKIGAENRRDCLTVMAEIARKIVIAYREGQQLPIVQKQKIQELKHKSDNNSPFSSAMQQSAGRYSFPSSHIFDPNSKSPYIDTSILRPEEQLRREK